MAMTINQIQARVKHLVLYSSKVLHQVKTLTPPLPTFLFTGQMDTPGAVVDTPGAVQNQVLPAIGTPPRRFWTLTFLPNGMMCCKSASPAAPLTSRDSTGLVIS